MRRLGLVGFVCLLLMAGLTVISTPANAFTLTCSAKTKAQIAACDTSGYAEVYTKMHWRMYGGHNCTNYAAYRMQRAGVPEPKILLGNARDWHTNAAKLGYTVNSQPAVGAIAQWSKSANHVAYVEEVGAGYLILSEDSYSSKVYRRYKALTTDSWYPERFIHFLTPGTTTPAPTPTPTPAPAPAPAPTPAKVVTSKISVSGPAKVSTRVAPTVTVKVTAAGGVLPQGTVRVRRGGRIVATANVTAASKGTVKVKIPRMKRGKQWISAVYAGSPAAKASTSRTIKVTVTKPPKVVSSKTTVALPKGTILTGTRPVAAVTVRATDGRAMTNKVSVYVDGKLIAAPRVTKKNKGKVTVRLPALAPGNHTIRATYWGSKPVRRSQAKATTFAVAEQTTITSAAAKSKVGSQESVSLTAKVATARGVAPTTGEVWVLADGVKVAATPLTPVANGTVTIALPVLAPGTRQISATYRGSAFQLASTSAAQPVLVMEPSTTTAALAKTTVKPTEQARLTITVRSAALVAAPTGTIVVRDGAKQIASATLAPARNGTVALTLPKLTTIGAHKLTATFGGTDLLEPSTTAVLTLTVKK